MNYHVFNQFMEAATKEEQEVLGLDGLGIEDFRLLNRTGTCERRDGVMDGDMHPEMLDIMVTIGFNSDTIHSLLRLITAILQCGNITFTSRHQSNANNMADASAMDKTHSAHATASLLGVTLDDLAHALTYRAIFAGNEVVHSPLDKI